MRHPRLPSEVQLKAYLFSDVFPGAPHSVESHKTDVYLSLSTPYGNDICPRLLCIVVSNLMNGWMGEWINKYQLAPFELFLNCLDCLVLHSSVYILLQGCFWWVLTLENFFYITKLEHKLFLEPWLDLLGSSYSTSLNVTAVLTDSRHFIWPEAAF